MPPMEFIPVAEDSGLIVVIGEWVLETACRQNKKWIECGLEPHLISVNLSARQFQPLSISNSSNVAMLGVYISMIKTLEENLEKVLKAIRSLIIEDMAKDMPMLAPDSRASTKHSRYRTYLCCYHSG